MALSLPALLLVLCSLGVAQATVRVYSLRGSGLNSDATSATDGFVKVFCDSRSLGRTQVRPNNASPWWEEEFTYYPAVQGSILRVEVYDQDVTFDDKLGSCQSSLKPGTYAHTCYLEKGGSIRFNTHLS
ncbi:Perforin-1 [Nibea albiflora]|uniref:Perforin-1 n=1 Tax=Nibea albiflora TaxID=240163 RepID=A0ACB7F3D8_NIBAL|nr:Perforin-1 [Nibea albiflora]